MVFTDGRIEIELAPVQVCLDSSEDLPRLTPAAELPPLSDEEVRDTIEATRR